MCADKVIGFRAETCEGCGQIYNGYNHVAAVEHHSCLVRLQQARLVNAQIDNPEKWRLLRERFSTLSLVNILHTKEHD
jgi:hypothetical protein